MTWATSMPILVFLGLSSRLRPDVRDRQTDVTQTTDVRRASSLNASALCGRGHNKPQVNLDVRKYFFSNRVIDIWNNIPASLIDCNTIDTFKKK